jgi:hypothetical protein
MQKTGRVAYSGPAASLADHDPTVTMREFLKLLGHLRIHPAATSASRRYPVRQRWYVCWLIPSRRQTSRTFVPLPRSTLACRSKPTICSALRRFFI